MGWSAREFINVLQLIGWLVLLKKLACSRQLSCSTQTLAEFPRRLPIPERFIGASYSFLATTGCPTIGPCWPIYVKSTTRLALRVVCLAK